MAHILLSLISRFSVETTWVPPPGDLIAGKGLLCLAQEQPWVLKELIPVIMIGCIGWQVTIKGWLQLLDILAPSYGHRLIVLLKDHLVDGSHDVHQECAAAAVAVSTAPNGFGVVSDRFGALLEITRGTSFQHHMGDEVQHFGHKAQVSGFPPYQQEQRHLVQVHLLHLPGRRVHFLVIIPPVDRIGDSLVISGTELLPPKQKTGEQVAMQPEQCRKFQMVQSNDSTDTRLHPHLWVSP